MLDSKSSDTRRVCSLTESTANNPACTYLHALARWLVRPHRDQKARHTLDTPEAAVKRCSSASQQCHSYLRRLVVEVVGELDFSETEVELERDGVVQVLVEVERIHHTCDEGGINGGPTKQAWSANAN